MIRLSGLPLQGYYAEAYVHAIASAAGFVCTKPSLDSGHKIDFQISSAGPSETTREPRLDVQVKSTTQPRLADGVSHYDFDDQLHAWAIKPPAKLFVPRVVVLVQLPDDPESWTEQSDEQMIARHCAYWVSLRGRPSLVAPAKSRSIHFDRGRKFDVPGLVTLMASIEGGEWP